MSKFYRVGVANNPKRTDFQCLKESDAIDTAQLMSLDLGFGTTIAVWDDKDDPVYVFVLGEQFRRV